MLAKFSSDKPFPILQGYDTAAYTAIDLSVTNTELVSVDMTNPEQCQDYISTVLVKHKAKVAYGGYLEKRNLYADASLFTDDAVRNIHLGVDFWAPAGTPVITPFDGRLHSFANNATKGDYGPTIILQHSTEEGELFTLYGHLSLSSIEKLEVGQLFKQGSILGYLGETAINVNYAPHLHFQVIRNLNQHKGDYPGVCAANDLAFYRENCPNPRHLIGWG